MIKKIMLICLVVAGLTFGQTLVETLGKDPASWKRVADKAKTKEQVTEFINASKQILPTLTEEEVKNIAFEISKTEFFRIVRVVNMNGAWAFVLKRVDDKYEIEYVWKTKLPAKGAGQISQPASKD